MKRFALSLLLLVCLVAVTAAAADLRCGIARPSSASIVVACSASRLEAKR